MAALQHRGQNTTCCCGSTRATEFHSDNVTCGSCFTLNRRSIPPSPAFTHGRIHLSPQRPFRLQSNRGSSLWEPRRDEMVMDAHHVRAREVSGDKQWHFETNGLMLTEAGTEPLLLLSEPRRNPLLILEARSCCFSPQIHLSSEAEKKRSGLFGRSLLGTPQSNLTLGCWVAHRSIPNGISLPGTPAQGW